VNRPGLLWFHLPADLLLCFPSSATSGEIDDLSPLKEAGQFSFAEQLADVVMDASPDELLEFLHGATGGCLLDDSAERLWQIAMFREVDVLMGPEAVLIEAWDLFERDEGGIVIDAAEVTDLGERPLDGFSRALKLFGERPPLRDTIPPELPDDLGLGAGELHVCPPM
jgi:hypothetical protein